MIESARGILRYLRLYGSFARYCLVREMAFRVNFLARCAMEFLWLGLIIMFFHLIYLRTERIGDWDKYQYLFFMGTGFILSALVDSLFLENCTNLSELIRTGDLDFALLKPIDEQFLLSCQRIDWSTVPNLLLGVGLLLYSCFHTGVALTPLRALNYAALVMCGLAIMYSLMLIMAASSVWIIRNRGLYEMWFYVTQFARYPADIYRGGWLGIALRFGLTFVLPVLLAVNVPAQYGAGKLEHSGLVAYLAAAALVSLAGSRSFFRFALRSYRSASS